MWQAPAQPNAAVWILGGMSGFLAFDATFTGEVVYWRGPSPFHFVPVPAAEAREIRDFAPMVSYGWGVIPVRVRIGGTSFTTSLFPKDGRYLVPIKDSVRRAEGLAVGDRVTVELEVGG
jgi:Domain of unknown function (DUF1905)